MKAKILHMPRPAQRKRAPQSKGDVVQLAARVVADVQGVPLPVFTRHALFNYLMLSSTGRTALQEARAMLASNGGP